MKINLSVLKDEDTKDTITYQKLVLGLNNVSSCCVPGLHPCPLHHTFLTRLSREVGEEFGDGHHLG